MPDSEPSSDLRKHSEVSRRHGQCGKAAFARDIDLQLSTNRRGKIVGPASGITRSDDAYFDGQLASHHINS
jgi:hypothetical protein